MTFYSKAAVTVFNLALLAACACAQAQPKEPAQPATRPTVRGISPSATYTEIVNNADLMVGGQIVPDPLDDRVRYYVARESLYRERENSGKTSGILLSFDQGKTWHVLSRQFDFKFLFVQPVDGRLYAIIGYEWLETREDGFLQHCFADKVVVSNDGQHWKDITRGPGYVARLSSIFQDPDHPKRVCLGADVIRYSVISYVDDEYSNWTWSFGMRGVEKQPTTRSAN